MKIQGIVKRLLDHRIKVGFILVAIIFLISVYFLGRPQPQTSTELNRTTESTPKEIEEYYAVYKNPYVLFLRKALSAYLAGDGSQVCILQGAVKEDHREGIITGLDAFDKEYYKSKFIVATIGDNQENGKDIQIIFQDKPDRIFYAWVGKNPDGDTCLIGFNSKEYFDPDKVKDLNEVYKEFLLDKEHAL
ncbi:MAG: hypothetical protein A2629_00225 [Candidatus Levybacteria bacterium RIFCSPHIGHO2_01_FULL_41_15]|nr:MAG: hypothetical protein A2629_00225 [Candidatus Levybacteria bacterium RIFCSPHIGHO2_01_FULL_41_15]